MGDSCKTEIKSIDSKSTNSLAMNQENSSSSSGVGYTYPTNSDEPRTIKEFYTTKLPDESLNFENLPHCLAALEQVITNIYNDKYRNISHISPAYHPNRPLYLDHPSSP
jgi:hypothetical protein